MLWLVLRLHQDPIWTHSDNPPEEEKKTGCNIKIEANAENFTNIHGSGEDLAVLDPLNPMFHNLEDASETHPLKYSEKLTVYAFIMKL